MNVIRDIAFSTPLKRPYNVKSRSPPNVRDIATVRNDDENDDEANTDRELSVLFRVTRRSCAYVGLLSIQVAGWCPVGFLCCWWPSSAIAAVA